MGGVYAQIWAAIFTGIFPTGPTFAMPIPRGKRRVFVSLLYE
jgi:hypothetical protein